MIFLGGFSGAKFQGPSVLHGPQEGVQEVPQGLRQVLSRSSTHKGTFRENKKKNFKEKSTAFRIATHTRKFISLNRYFWLKFIYVYQRSLKRTLKPGFWAQNHLLNLCSRVVNSQRLYSVVKEPVLNVCIEAFWYTKIIYYFDCIIISPYPCKECIKRQLHKRNHISLFES